MYRGQEPSATAAPLLSTKTAFSEALAGLPIDVRFSLETARVIGSPDFTWAAVELATATERRPKSGDTGLCSRRYLIHASRSTRPVSLVLLPSLKTRKLSPPVARKLKVPILYSLAGSITAPFTQMPVMRSPAGRAAS
ncbi:hypothetical protein PJL18_00650 [Paenarthrobacter nicotinovorans]|nr:hypothetical protein [Paenarthrobacter nicotinovorans]